ncbi:hypothetical protein [Streptomyces sp. NPDC056361]|uniref:hypothetical protein n=1 Tax=Streptomyces sp. NPDC056361 TaxID=3345795 RepID=UPI0035D7D66A
MAPATLHCSNFVVTGDKSSPWLSQVFMVHDMAAPAVAPVRVDLREFGEDYAFGGVVGATLIVHAMQGDTISATRLVTVAEGRTTHREVTGLPTGNCWSVAAFGPGSALFNCETPQQDSLTMAVVDLATAAVVELREDGAQGWWPGAVSTTHLAWQSRNDRNVDRIAVARRGSADVRYVEGPGFNADEFHLLGGWVVSGYPMTLEKRAPYAPGRPLLARLAETGETVEVLTHHSSAVTAPDGSLLVRGGTLDRNEGLYRVSLGEDGKPVAKLVASTGQATAVKYLGTSVPDAITFDRMGQGVDLGWDFSRVDTDVWLTLVHTRTGESLRRKIWSTDPASPGEGHRNGQRIGWRWDGSNPINPLKAAYNGDYTWEITASPDDGIGPTLMPPAGSP